MSLSKLTTIAFLTVCGALFAGAIAKAQTGNTGGSSGGTGSGQSGTGSGPAASAPSLGGGTFTGNPDANPYAKDSKDSFITETTSSSETAAPRRTHRRTTKTVKHSSSHKSKKKIAASPSPTPSPAPSGGTSSSHP